MKLIDKSASVAEINKRIIDAPINNIGHQRVWAYNDVKDILDTFEKEVDLEKEIEEYLSIYWSNEKDLHPFLGHVAKHFFELGLKAQKGEEV